MARLTDDEELKRELVDQAVAPWMGLSFPDEWLVDEYARLSGRTMTAAEAEQLVARARALAPPA